MKFVQTVAECAYFVWVDDEPTEWYSELIGDLRDEVWRMRKQVMEQGPLVKCFPGISQYILNTPVEL